MEELGERAGCRWWADNVEYELWARAVGDTPAPLGPRALDVVPYASALRALADAAGGWWRWRAHLRGKVVHEDLRFTPAPEWRRRYAAWRASSGAG